MGDLVQREHPKIRIEYRGGVTSRCGQLWSVEAVVVSCGPVVVN